MTEKDREGREIERESSKLKSLQLVVGKMTDARAMESLQVCSCHVPVQTHNNHSEVQYMINFSVCHAVITTMMQTESLTTVRSSQCMHINQCRSLPSNSLQQLV